MFNCAEKIQTTLESIKEGLHEWTGTYEVIVVNDGSTDRTLACLKGKQEVDSRIRIVTYPANKGKGYAVKQGILACLGLKCIFIDGDMDISPAKLEAYFLEMEDSVLVVGSKVHKLSIVKASKARKFLSQSFAFFVRMATGVRINDTQSGLKGGNSELLKKIFTDMRVSRYAFDVELLLMASKAGVKIKEMPIELTLTSKFKVKEIIRMLYDVLKISYHHRFKNEQSYRHLLS